MLELSDVGLMNKSTEVTRHKAGTKVEWGIHYVFDQTDKGFTLNGLGIYTHEAQGSTLRLCYKLTLLLVSIHLLYDAIQ